ncbi:DUF3302 domain-containing protein [Lysobacter sp. S4-A87]|uniref:DUF3302 domain-containing protein n=1 Tax=Lysobacter sp. S4-A87 TaxID=2925843 RepID=UPI001F53C01C|nr:DUF3302 domain-containing protein [Lysobacter sp. S4-A87]UNK50058.1 DUF3302 domain-containing protein [Lysobacter sp. S4-A87]
MKATRPEVPCRNEARRRSRAIPRLLSLVLTLQAGQAMASGGMEDKIADVMVWVVIVVAPLLGLAVFWTVHVWPERVAQARDHPQKEAIQVLSLLSLVFGGLLWPLAMLWAYMKPLRFRLEPPDAGTGPATAPAVTAREAVPDPHFDGAVDEAPADEELVVLREQVAALQERLDAMAERGAAQFAADT